MGTENTEGRQQVLVATVIGHNPEDWGPGVSTFVESIRAQYLYDRDQMVPGGAEYAGAEIVFRVGFFSELAKELVRESVENGLAEPANIDVDEARIYRSGGRVVSQQRVRNEDEAREVFTETLDRLQSNPIITRETLIGRQAAMLDGPQVPPEKAYGRVTAIYPQEKKRAIVEVDPGNGKPFYTEVSHRQLGTFGERHPDGVNLGDPVRYDRNLPEAKRPQLADLDLMESIAVQPGKYHMVPLGVLPESGMTVVSHAGREKALDTSTNPEAEMAFAQNLGKPVELRVDRVGRMVVAPLERGQDRGVQR